MSPSTERTSARRWPRLPALSRRTHRPYLGLPGWNVGLLVLIAATTVWASIRAPGFLDVYQLLAAAQAEAVIALLSLGLAMVVIVGEIDISLTSNLALCTVVIGLLSDAGVPGALVVFCSLLAGVVLGLVNGGLVAWLGLPALAVTLGTMGAYQGAAYLIGGSKGYISFSPFISDIGGGNFGQVPISLVLFVVLAVLLAVLLARTTFGRSMYAVGRSPEVVRRNGTSVAGVKLLAFGLGGLTAGLSALVFVGYYGSGGGSSASGTILLVITVVALGGLDIYGGSGRVSSVVLSLVLISVLQDGMGLLNVNTTLQTIVTGLLLLLSLTMSRLLVGGVRLPRWRRLRNGPKESGEMPAAQ